MKHLPIHEVLPKIIQTLSTHSRLLLQAPPGAGKSTMVPLSLLDESWLEDKIIIMLEPRRLAARMVASRMAELLGEKVGQTVGYQIKMDNCSSSSTKILIVTEAILVRKLQSDQSLQNVALIIFDEFHERSIHTDLSLALSLQTQELLRADLKLLIMSATLDLDVLTQYIDELPVITSKGKSYDLDIEYLDAKTKQPDQKSLIGLTCETIMRSVQNDVGNILVFLAGVKEIKLLQKLLIDKLKTFDIEVYPLYSMLSKKEQDKAIFAQNKRKIILSTNIAQTSLTIEGIKVVIDTGLEKLSRYNHATGMNHLENSFIAADSATQRAGRAGRLSAGRCYRLWHEKKLLQKTTQSEILRCDLGSLILDLALWGVDEFEELVWLDIPKSDAIQHTKNMLQNIQMLDENSHITDFGKQCLMLGVHPRYAYMILRSISMGYVYEACLLSALLSEKDIFKNSFANCDIKERFRCVYEDEIDAQFINAFVLNEVLKIASNLYQKLKKTIDIKNDSRGAMDLDILGVLVLFAYPDRLAKRRSVKSEKYKLSNGKGAVLSNEDELFNQPYLVVPNLFAKEKDSIIFQAIAVSLEDIETYFKANIHRNQSLTYNKQSVQFDLKEHVEFMHLELYSKALKLDQNHDIQALLLELIKTEGLDLLSWNTASRRLKDRVNFYNKHCVDTLKDFSHQALLNTLEQWLVPYLSEIKTVKALQNLNMNNILLAQLSWEEIQRLDELLPTHFTVPSGANIALDYSDEKAVVLAVKIQQVFGLHQTPKVLNHTVPVQLHLLSPASRPIQITYDLESFWKNSYDEVRKELRGKYKKHYWPQNPYEAVATNVTKKRMKT
ncbi:MAG: ATP-dependent helicase HrpB [Campylobacterota bacterium]|nr:ATP-dependent helicase HrpB [Campylobacterota bacterium]